ncbi:MAG: peptide ABC transporter permease [Chlamydiae bacterium SM23_39]|nr:MAG: peptide ABC transporter permease [Chlamydiae bacterium SM23_39]
MLNYLLKKLMIFLLSILFVITLTFILMKSIPGDPFISSQEIPKETLAALYKYYGLDKPLHLQYLKYIKGFLKADLGPSFIYQGRTVNQIIRDGFPVSIVLGLEALSLSIFFGIFFGSLAALKKNKWQDHFYTIVAIIGISVPNFLLATFLQYIFAIKLKILPVARWDNFLYTILPAISLSALPTAFIARIIRTNMIEVLEQDYIKNAYAKGLTHFKVIFRHGLKNALIPILSYIGPIATYVLTGSFVIEKIFGIPGLGQWLILSISNRDYTVILGLTVFFSSILITLVFLGDVLTAMLDPRIKIIPKKLKYEK